MENKSKFAVLAVLLSSLQIFGPAIAYDLKVDLVLDPVDINGIPFIGGQNIDATLYLEFDPTVSVVGSLTSGAQFPNVVASVRVDIDATDLTVPGTEETLSWLAPNARRANGVSDSLFVGNLGHGGDDQFELFLNPFLSIGGTTTQMFPEDPTTVYELNTVGLQVTVNDRLPVFSEIPLVSEISSALSAIDLTGPNNMANNADLFFSNVVPNGNSIDQVWFAGSITSITAVPVPASLVLMLGPLCFVRFLGLFGRRSQ